MVAGVFVLNASFGVKWSDDLTVVLEASNLLNNEVRQHLFGDLLRRSVVAEVRIRHTGAAPAQVPSSRSPVRSRCARRRR